ncbi:MAG: ATPase, T2SS/T4P/T4SS family [Patescibacteria group bacterium]
MPGSSTGTLLLNTIFSVALEKKATDLHLMPGNYPVLRLEDKLYVLAEEQVLTVDTINALVDSWLTAEDKERLRSEREIRTVFTWADRARFRATIFYQQGYLAVSMRRIPESVQDPKSLLVPEVVLDKIAAMQGLLIICGSFNSGRTTTVASLIQHINMNYSKRITTLERPIEYIFANNRSVVNQREIGRDTPSFVHGMRDLLDDDVDVVTVTELMELGSHELALTLAEGGKLVIAIMNTNSSISAIENFLDNIPHDKRKWAKDSLASVLRAIVSQRLIPGIGGGRVLACEVLTMSPAVASIVQEEKFSQLNNVLQTSREEGMVSLDYRLNELVRGGKIAAEEAKKFALDPSNIRAR